MAVPGFFFKIEHGLFRVIGLKLAGEPQGVFDLISFSLLPFIIPPYLMQELLVFTLKYF